MICCHGHELIITSEGSTGIHRSENPEIVIQWYSLKYDQASRFYPNVKAHINYKLFVSAKLEVVLTFAKCVEFLKRITVRASLNAFSYFPL